MMNRRNALYSILILGGTTASFGGIKWYSLYKKPDLSFFDNKIDLLSELADIIIPETDTPGAKEAGVANSIIHLLKNCTNRSTLNTFIKGLSDLEDECHSNFGQSFVKCSLDEKNKILTAIDKSSKRPKGLPGKAMKKFLGDTFFQTLKEYSALTYFTSEIGATQSLNYVHIPTKYIGCTDLGLDQKCWATE